MKKLFKKDTEFVIWEDNGFLEILITQAEKGGNFYGEWLECQPDIDNLGIYMDDDMWYCDTMSRDELKFELENRGYKVCLGEEY